jgi:hypothetical protein
MNFLPDLSAYWENTKDPHENGFSDSPSNVSDYRVMPSTDGYAVNATEVTVKKIPDPASRSIIRQIILPKVSNRTFSGEVVEHGLTASNWFRWFAAEAKGDPNWEREMIRRKRFESAAKALSNAPGLHSLTVVIVDGDVSKQQSSSHDREVSEFVPSTELVEAWLEGVNENHQAAGEPLIPVAAAARDQRYSKELSRQIRKVIANFAKRKAYEGGRYLITVAKKMHPFLEGLIQDHLMLPPRNAVKFLDIFKAELYRQSANGPVFYGRWGELVVDERGELVFVLNKRRSRKLSTIIKG